jgi:AcrR family transcriptional regulator
MRVKTDARRKAILDAAWELFKEHGVERASMSEISARVGGSKATLYNYFSSKEELFIAAVLNALEDVAEEVFATLKGDSLSPMLRRFGLEYLKLRFAPDLMAVNRIMIAEGERSGLGPLMFDQVVAPKWGQLGKFLEEAMQRGELLTADAEIASFQLKALFECNLLEKRIHGCISGATNAELKADIDIAVDTFLRAYAPEHSAA